MKIAVFTSVSSSYLPNARILCTSVKQHHPNWDFFLLFNDRTPDETRWEDENFDHIMFAEWLHIDRPWLKFAHDYNVIELCTATKASMSRYLLEDLKYDAIIYLDPDTCVFSPLEEVINIIETNYASVILTPHLTDAEDDDDGIWSHEIASLKHGVFNLGFFAIKNSPDGLKFASWWERRLLDYSHIDFEFGTLTDQKWVNLAPYMLPGIHVLCDRTYNVATWNIKGRHLTRDKSGNWLINGQSLRFYHFSGFGFDFGWANRELEVFARHNEEVKYIWDYYKKLYARNKSSAVQARWKWDYNRSGRKIARSARKLYDRNSTVDPFGLNL